MKTIENGSKSVRIAENTYASETTYIAVAYSHDTAIRSKSFKTEKGAVTFARKWLGL